MQRRGPFFLYLGAMVTLVGCISYFGWTRTWSALFVPRLLSPFADMRVIQGAVISAKQGLNPHISNPNDIRGRSAELSADLGQNWPSCEFGRQVAVYPVLQLGDFMFCRDMCVYFVSLSVIRTACLPSFHSDVTRHRAGKYRSDHLFFGVPVCAVDPKKAIIRSNLGRDSAEALSRIRFRRLVHQEAISPLFPIADRHTSDFRTYVGRIGRHSVEYDWVISST